MEIKELKIKENITPDIIAQAIEFVSNSCFVNGGYNPYYREFSERIAVIQFFLEGITFEDNDSLFVAAEVPEVKRLINKFVVGDINMKEPSKIMATIRTNVDSIIEFKKQRLIHGADAIEYIASAVSKNDNFIGDLDVALGNLSKIKLNEVTKEDVDMARALVTKLNNAGVELTTENIAKIIKEASNFDVDKASQDIIDAKNAEIETLRGKVDELNKKLAVLLGDNK